MAKSKVIYLGTPEISAEALRGLIESGIVDVVGVITKPDQMIGRKMVMTPSPVAMVAQEYGIPCHKPLKLNKDYDFIVQKDPDLLLTFAYGQIISSKVLALSKYKPLNVHGSLLPKYRGAAPIQYALKDGETKTGVCLMEMVKEMDAGDVYQAIEVPIEPSDNYTTLARKISDAGLKLLVQYLPDYLENKLVGVKQDESKVTFCPSIKKEEEHIPSGLKPTEFVNYVRALSETPGAFLLLDGAPFKIYEASVETSEGNYGQEGEIIKADSKGLVLALKEGSVSLKVIQKSGKKKMDYKSFVNGEKEILHKILL